MLSIAPTAWAQETEPPVAAPGDPSLVRLERLSAQLGSSDPTERRAAYDALTTLDEEMLPAIRARVARLSRGRPPENWARDILTRFRVRAPREEGVDTDIAPGVLEELGREHRPQERGFVLAMAEPLLLWRSLERIGTFEAQQAAYPLIGLDDGLWMPEARNWVRRCDDDLMAAALAARSDRDRHVRSWSRWAVETLGAEDPGRAIQSLTEEQLPDVLRAYAMLRVQSAMRVIVSYTASDRRRIRRAARWALEQYGGNAIWTLRTAYHARTGEHAPREWSWQRLGQELYARADAQRLAPVRAALEAANEARAREDWATMRARFDEVLAHAPELEDPGSVAEGYAAMAEARAAAGHPSDAIHGYRRALRLSPEHAQAARWSGELRYLEARGALDRGVLDMAAFEGVLALSPEHEGARAALASAPAVVRSAPLEDRRKWGLIAAFLIALFGVGLLWRPADSSRQVDAHADTTIDTTMEAPASFADAADRTLADQTLPG